MYVLKRNRKSKSLKIKLFKLLPIFGFYSKQAYNNI